MAIEIRELAENDVSTYWPLRLRALHEEPEAFGSSYEETKDRPIEQVAAQLSETSHKGGLNVGAFADGELVGMAALVRHQGMKIRHIADIFAVYVAPEARGQHASRLLLEATIARARTSPGLEQLHLGVVTTQTAAQALYRSLDFSIYGRIPHALKLPDGRYLDEDFVSDPIAEARGLPTPTACFVCTHSAGLQGELTCRPLPRKAV